MKISVEPFKVLRFRNYRLFWISLFASQVAFYMQILATNWQLYDLTKSPLALGVVGLMGFLPIFLFSLISGVISDKVDRKKLMVASQCILFVLSLLLAVTTITGVVTPLLIYITLFCVSTVFAFDLPARQSIIPHLVPKEYFINAVSLSALIRQSSIIVGPAISGFVIEYVGVEGIYCINIVVFLLSAITMLLVHPTAQKIEQSVTLSLASIMEGIHFVRRSPLIASTMLLDFFATFFASATVLLPIFAVEILGTGEKGLGMMAAAPAVGALITGILFSSLSHVKRQGTILLASVILFGLSTIGFGLSRSFPLSLFFLMLIGATDMVSMIIRNTIRQLMTPDYIRGRMSGVNQIFFAGGPMLGEAEAGVLAAAIGSGPSVVVGGIGAIAATMLIGYFVPRLRRYDGHESPDKVIS